MSEIKRARLNDTDEIIDVDMGEPTRSSKMFKHISDEIWKQRKSNDLAVAWLPRNLDAADLDEFNKTLVSIDGELVLAGETTRREVEISDPYGGEELRFSSQDLTTPSGGGIETFNWDERMRWSLLDVNKDTGRHDVAHWVDEPAWYRELGVRFEFSLPSREWANVHYSLQRLQEHQSDPTSVYANIWYSGYAETGYEGHSIGRAELTDEQEMKLLRTIARLGGVGLRGA